MKYEHEVKKVSAAKPSILKILSPYRWLVIGLLVLALISNGLNLIIPKIIQEGIDSFSAGHFGMRKIVWAFALTAGFIFLLTYLQSIVQSYASEKVARDIRQQLSEKLSQQTYTYIQDIGPNKLLTNLTSDVDAVKNFVSQAIVNIISSVVLIIGAAVLLLNINWKLGLVVLLIIPVIAGAFFLVFKKVKTLFRKTQEILDRLNKIINEAILGSALIRVLNAQMTEYNKFIEASGKAKHLGLSILRLFALLIPVITFTANMGQLAVLLMGGHFVISGNMTLGEFAAFNSYIAILIFPILLIGFMSNVIARASASYGRIFQILNMEDPPKGGTITNKLDGAVDIKNLTVQYGEKKALKNVSLKVPAGSRTAIIGPTAAGKTQLFYALITLIKPQEGAIFYDGENIENYDQETLLRQVGLVFQDAVIFNMSLRENIAFDADISVDALQKAIDTAELGEFIAGLPDGLDTVVSERGNSLSGGQKQRVMLARALAGNPRILLLDEFTARVDKNTELKIEDNVRKNYPEVTLLNITQNLSSVQDYDQIVLLMEGEIIAVGTHECLMQSSPEYVQIFQSQQSTSSYEA